MSHKNKILLILTICILLFFYLLWLKANAKESFSNLINFNVKIADNDELRAKGYMFRKKKLSDLEGMLFKYPHPQIISLWMKNTFIPLDVLYLDENYIIKEFNENLIPHNEASVKSKGKYKIAMEINGGCIKRRKINIGDKLKISIL